MHLSSNDLRSAGFVAAGPEDGVHAEDSHSAEAKVSYPLFAEVPESQEELLHEGDESSQAGYSLENFELGMANTKVGHIYRAMRSMYVMKRSILYRAHLVPTRMNKKESFQNTE